MENRAHAASPQGAPWKEDRDLAPRLRPVQQRAKDTVEWILDAAAALLEERGYEGFNTNLVARVSPFAASIATSPTNSR